MTDLTGTRDLVEILYAHLAGAADPTVLDGQIESIVAATAARRQRPAWLASLTSRSMTTTTGPWSSAAWVAILVLTLVLALAVWGITVASWRPTPPAPVVNGPIIFERYNTTSQDTVLFVVRPDGSGLHQLSSGGTYCPQFSPDGRKITTGFGVANANGTSARAFPSTVGGVSLGCSIWSPDGRTLAVEGITEDSQNVSESGIYLADAADGRITTKLTTSGARFADTPYGWSPDGRQIAYMHGDLGPVAPTLRVVQVATGIAHEVFPEPVYPGAAWSPDGNWIVIAPTGDSRFVFVRPDGSEQRSVTVPASAAYLAFPRFSPDGTRLVFAMTLTGQTNPDIYTMKIDGTDLVRITNTPDDGESFTDWGVDPR